MLPGLIMANLPTVFGGCRDVVFDVDGAFGAYEEEAAPTLPAKQVGGWGRLVVSTRG